MAFSLADIKKRAEAAAKTGPDYNEQKAGGGNYVPPAEGFTKLRLVKYIEVGVHTTKSTKFGDKTKPRAVLVFELSGKKHEPKKLDDGRLIPYTIEIKEPIGQNKKNNFSKLFKEMVKEHPSAKNFGELVGEAFTAKVVHRKFKGSDGSDRVIAELKGENGYTITGVTFEDPETETVKRHKVGDPITPLGLFLWDYADLEQWDSIFIDGTYDNGDSKNKYQETVKQAENLDGSPIYEALIAAGREEELVPAPKAARTPAGGTPQPAADEEEDEAPAPAPAPAKKAKAAPAPEPEDEDEVEDEVEEDEPVQEAPKKAPSKAVAAPKTAVKGKAPAAAKAAPKAAKRAAVDDDADPLAGL